MAKARHVGSCTTFLAATKSRVPTGRPGSPGHSVHLDFGGPAHHAHIIPLAQDVQCASQCCMDVHAECWFALARILHGTWETGCPDHQPARMACTPCCCTGQVMLKRAAAGREVGCMVKLICRLIKAESLVMAGHWGAALVLSSIMLCLPL